MPASSKWAYTSASERQAPLIATISTGYGVTAVPLCFSAVRRDGGAPPCFVLRGFPAFPPTPGTGPCYGEGAINQLEGVEGLLACRGGLGSFMKQGPLCGLQELGTSSGCLRAVSVGFRGTAMALLLLLTAAGRPAPAAQRVPSHAAEIRNHLQKASEYLQANDPVSAIKELDAVLALDPKNADANANLGVIAFFEHDYKAASQYLRNALAIDPSLVKTQALLGICERRLGQPSAKALLEKSFPKLKDQKLRVQTGLELANIYFEEGNLDECASVMRTLVNLDPDNVEILYMAQLVYSEMAEDTLNKLAIIAPGSARMQQVIAEHLVNQGDLKGAIEHYKKALAIDPRAPGIHYELAQAILQWQRSEPSARREAKKYLESSIALEGDSVRTECQLGSIALLDSDFSTAQDHYTRAYELDPHDPEAQLGLGRVLLQLDNAQEAVKYLEQSVASDPLNASAHYQLAQAYRHLQMTEKAQKELQLFREIKTTKDRVAQLYQQMNRNAKPPVDDVPDTSP
jgi:tetratricopeptide (TPR) repeat protein